MGDPRLGRIKKLGVTLGPKVGTNSLQLRFKVRRILRRLKGVPPSQEDDLQTIHAFLTTVSFAASESRFWAALSVKQQLELCKYVRWSAAPERPADAASTRFEVVPRANAAAVVEVRAEAAAAAANAEAAAVTAADSATSPPKRADEKDHRAYEDVGDAGADDGAPPCGPEHRGGGGGGGDGEAGDAADGDGHPTPSPSALAAVPFDPRLRDLSGWCVVMRGHVYLSADGGGDALSSYPPPDDAPLRRAKTLEGRSVLPASSAEERRGEGSCFGTSSRATVTSNDG